MKTATFILEAKDTQILTLSTTEETSEGRALDFFNPLLSTQ